MTEHVHVRQVQGLGVSDDGLLVEESRCRCGATWTRTYEAGSPEQE
ncbi:hypothetical protein [Streptomyces sulfonofaciens]|nr:hypothetical protein [Streptomyces sulfonofaciens]